jgi:NAD(P)-dependent dehydrogenase (short-subunit alcohol dehydrogenase family)
MDETVKLGRRQRIQERIATGDLRAIVDAGAPTRALSQALADKKIRVNAVAPGPIWTPLIAASFSPRKVATFGSDVPLGRAGEPAEVAPCYVFLASADSSYMTGQVLHPNGGEIVNG